MDLSIVRARLFAPALASGAGSGFPMQLWFGTNGPDCMETAGKITAPLPAYRVLTDVFIAAVLCTKATDRGLRFAVACRIRGASLRKAP